jgi:hypothetical protein
LLYLKKIFMLDTINHYGKSQHGDAYQRLFLDIINLLIKNLPNMANELDKLTSEVNEARTVQASAAALLKSLHDRLVAAGTDKAKLAQLASDLDTGSNDLAAAVAANTVAEDEDPGTGTGGGENGGDTTNADGSVTHADGTTTHPDGSVTAADGTVITGPTNG